MNREQFNILPNYIDRKFNSKLSQPESKSIINCNIESSDELNDTSIIKFDTEVSENEWIIYLDGSYSYEYPSRKFWCKPQFIIRPLISNIQFKYLLLKLSIPAISNNKLTVNCNNELLFENDIVDEDIDIVLSYRSEYTFNCLPFCPKESNDKRVLGAYITCIKIVDNNDFVYPLSLRNIIVCDYKHLLPFVV